MSQIPFIPENAPFTSEQRHWLNGYLAGLFSNARTLAEGNSAPRDATASQSSPPLLVLYGSQTGTAEGLAKKAAKAAATRAFVPTVVCMESYDSVNFAQEENLLVITSTYGDGEPPDNAQSFWQWLSSESAPRLDHLRYSVLALGDTSYPQFCEFGKKCDQRLEQLGAYRIHDRADCDVDYETPAASWMENVFIAFGRAPIGSGASPTSVATFTVSGGTSRPSSDWSRKNAFAARLKLNRKLNGEGSEKDVRHLEISLAGSNIGYEVGDALGVMPSNCPELVFELLTILGCDGEEAVPPADGEEIPLRLALLRHYDITKPSPELLKAVASREPGGELCALLQSERHDDLQNWLWGREVIDVLLTLSRPFTGLEFVGLLKKLQPRLYSISSSIKAHPEEVHLTVGTVRHKSHGRMRKGVCSTFLADRCSAESPLPIWVQPSHGFKLPADLTRPIIMVGPGTGIAPFRAFLEERQVTGATGKNWLFFGEQRRAADFLYKETLETWIATGHLARLDVAFSRDHQEKLYVQHRMREAAGELWAWLESGAHFYVCGDGSRMAKDVDATLHEVAQLAGALNPKQAKEYVARLKLEKRYQRDVY